MALPFYKQEEERTGLTGLLQIAWLSMKVSSKRKRRFMPLTFLLSLPLQLLPSLYEAGRKCASDGDVVNCILADTAAALSDEFNRSIQVHIQTHPLFTSPRRPHHRVAHCSVTTIKAPIIIRLYYFTKYNVLHHRAGLKPVRGCCLVFKAQLQLLLSRLFLDDH